MVYRTCMSSDDEPPTPTPLQIGGLLRSAWTEVMDEIYAGLAAAGYSDLRPVHRPLIRDLLLGRQRPTELAASLGLSKQAVNDILREFERNGYITLEADPDDGRAKRIGVTERGRSLAMTAGALSQDVGRRWAEQVGIERYEIFEEVLREIVAGTTDKR